MTLKKAVKVPSRLAHIGNYPHKRTAANERRMTRLRGRISALVDVLLSHNNLRWRLNLYAQLQEALAEMRLLPGYDEWDARNIFIEAKCRRLRGYWD